MTGIARRAWTFITAGLDPPMVRESRGSGDFERRHAPLAPGSRFDPTADRYGCRGPAQCGACGLLTITPKGLRLHRTSDGQCADPARWPLGGRSPLALVYVTPDGRRVWGHARGPYPLPAAVDEDGRAMWELDAGPGTAAMWPPEPGVLTVQAAN